MENRTFSISFILFIVVIVLRLLRVVLGEPRDQIVQITCQKQIPQNISGFVVNAVVALENVKQELQTQGCGAETSRRGHDAAYALTQCYGDLSVTDCLICYIKARSFFPRCPPIDAGSKLLDGCFIRTESYNFFQEYTGPEDKAICGNRTRKSSAFQQTTRQAVLQAASDALINNGYARAQKRVAGTKNESAYVLAQCWRTLNVDSCKTCLENALTSILGCLPWSEGRAPNTGCFMRYSDTNFLNPIPSNGSSSGTPTAVIAAVVSSAIVATGAAIIVAYILKHRRIHNKRKGSYDVKKLAKILCDNSLNFKYSTLEKASGGFDEANKLGQGGYGIVYKGVLPDGREIAIKRLFLNNVHRITEFYNEVNIISCIEHKNLVKLLGCSCFGPDSLLVYEFLPNTSLDRFIFDSNKGKTLDWEKRFVIIIGTANDLVYLHENPKIQIIHRDIKASNILLDVRFRAKIADFGLARAFQEDKSHISTIVAGTLFYCLSTEDTWPQNTWHMANGEKKTDVYSFGVLLLEIVTGQQNNRSRTSYHSSESLVTIVWKHFQQGAAYDLIDPNLMLHDNRNISTKNEVLRVIHVGLLCTQEISSLRPSMSAALQMLANKDEHLLLPTNPPFIYEKIIEINGMSFPPICGKPDSVATISHNIVNPR